MAAGADAGAAHALDAADGPSIKAHRTAGSARDEAEAVPSAVDRPRGGAGPQPSMSSRFARAGGTG